MKPGLGQQIILSNLKQSSYSQIQLQQMELSALRSLRQEEGELEAILNYMTPCLQKQTKTTY